MVGINKNAPAEAKSSRGARDVSGTTIETRIEGEAGTLEYRLRFNNADGKMISPWHSIPLYASKGLLNFVCEIPRGTSAKFEVATGEPGNPIKQDSKKGKPRNYGIQIKWNYGMLPQTWEDPEHASEDCDGYIGDNDPVDVVEIGDHTAVSGGVYTVKPIAALAMIDEGELDWKIIAIATEDPRYELVSNVEDLEVHFPGTISAIREWFRTYKTFEGKPENKFALNEEAMDCEYTGKVIRETHAFWESMVSKSLNGGKLASGVVVGDVPTHSSPIFQPVSEEAEEDALLQEGIEAMKRVLEVVSEHQTTDQLAKGIAGQKRHPSEQDLTRPSGIETDHEVKRHEVAVVA